MKILLLFVVSMNAAILVGFWSFFKLYVYFHEKRTMRRCQCGRRCYSLRAWRLYGNIMREPFRGKAHSNVRPCFPIPEENNLNPQWHGGES